MEDCVVHIIKRVMKSTKMVHHWDLGFLTKGKSDPSASPVWLWLNNLDSSRSKADCRIKGAAESVHRGRAASQLCTPLPGLGPFLSSASSSPALPRLHLLLPPLPRALPCLLQLSWSRALSELRLLKSQLHFCTKTVAMSEYSKVF